ncbi:FBD domain [Arabidopsis thaliana x Arabidopsis arenosa]|uniref:FBD domain n=1 Tax=Arabidopsis thaliana x Arabidopsis arenosa TaxID=1240361 RepID=A0A8T1YUX8_9BRAS|nr:FBD domain [Arabidopsis thaliana x Arabidopsis arenosa]
MDKISGFSDDELLVKILSFLPTKVAVSTSILSKQWRFLWMWVPKLEYDDTINCDMEKNKRMQLFIDRNLPLHRAPVIESLCLKSSCSSFQPKYIKFWVDIAVSRCLRELSVTFYMRKLRTYALLPSSLYTCKSLVTLVLKYEIFVDVPSMVCLPSLKTLHLLGVIYADEESLQRLLSNCSLLEDLVVKRCNSDNVRKFAVIIPSLLSFEITDVCTSDEYVIDTPSLKYFKARFLSKSLSCLIVNMPKLEEADIALRGSPDVRKLLKSVSSVRRLSLFLQVKNVEDQYGDDFIFNELEHLKFRISKTYWSKLLFWLLKGSPKLRDFELSVSLFYRLRLSRKAIFVRDSRDTLVCWKQMIDVPQCLLSSLQTFKWTTYWPTEEERGLATYILEKSCGLKTARILIASKLDPQKKLEMKNELFSSCGSTTCNINLVFN